jgi:hypothetical protein
MLRIWQRSSDSRNFAKHDVLQDQVLVITAQIRDSRFGPSLNRDSNDATGGASVRVLPFSLFISLGGLDLPETAA